MSDEFKIEVNDWLPGTIGAPETRETTAEISIQVNSFYATEVEDRPARSVRKSVRVSAFMLAYWLASNWWRIRWEPEKRMTKVNFQSIDWGLSHELASSGGGYVWPPITLTSDGYHMSVRCEGREKYADESLSPIRYLNSFSEMIDISSFEAGVSKFIEQVLSRLDARELRDSSLHVLWSEIRTERSKEPLKAKRKLEALLGVDPDEGDELVKGLLEWQNKVGKLAIQEVAAASNSNDVKATLEGMFKAAKSARTSARIADYGRIKSLLADKGSLASGVPWRFGREVASVVREVWGLGRKPIKNRDIAERLNLDGKFLTGVHSDTPMAIGIGGGQEDQLKLLLKRADPNGRRFVLSRLVGDHIGVDTEDHWKPATYSMTARQKFQRAFAAEFLCPSDELYDRYKDDNWDVDDVDEKSLEIGKEFQVSQQVVLNHLVNRDLIDSSLLKSFGVQPAVYSQ